MYSYCIAPIKFIYIATQKYLAEPDVTGLCVLTMAGTTLWMVDSPRQVLDKNKKPVQNQS